MRSTKTECDPEQPPLLANQRRASPRRCAALWLELISMKDCGSPSSHDLQAELKLLSSRAPSTSTPEALQREGAVTGALRCSPSDQRPGGVLQGGKGRGRVRGRRWRKGDVGTAAVDSVPVENVHVRVRVCVSVGWRDETSD